MKRQETLRSSSSCREFIPEKNQAKSIGCMSGIFHRVCKYQNRRKFLTSAGKRNKDVASSLAKPKPSPVSNASVETTGDGKDGNTLGELAKSSSLDCDFRRFSCDEPRSPTLPAAIRRSNSMNPLEIFLSPPALVARLMELDEIPASASRESTAEKRWKLLGALEKCDEDLKALKKIIDAVLSADYFRSPQATEYFWSPPAVDGSKVKAPASPESAKNWVKSDIKTRTISGAKHDTGGEMNFRDLTTREKRCSDVNIDRPSSVSVLDQCFSSPLRSQVCHAKRLQKGEQKVKIREDRIDLCFFNRLSTLSGRREEYYHFNYSATPSHKKGFASPFRNNKAMIERVHGVCMDVASGESRELGRIRLVLQANILGDLIKETVSELGFWNTYSLPLEACKRRLF